MFTKEELREKAKQIRTLLDIDQISSSIINTLRSTEIYQAAEHIMIFYPLEDEINLLPLLQDNKKFYLPKIQGEELVVCPYKPEDELVESRFKTKEPTTESINPEILDMIFLPALTVSKDFYRLGYGKGYYDKFLNKKQLRAIKIVPISSLLVKDQIPFDDNDAQFDIILDEL